MNLFESFEILFFLVIYFLDNLFSFKSAEILFAFYLSGKKITITSQINTKIKFFFLNIKEKKVYQIFKFFRKFVR